MHAVYFYEKARKSGLGMMNLLSHELGLVRTERDST